MVQCHHVKKRAVSGGMWVHTGTGLAAPPKYSPPTASNHSDPILSSIDPFTVQVPFV